MLFKLENWLKNRSSLLLVSLALLGSCSDDPQKQPATADTFPSDLVTDWIDLQLLYAKESPGFTPPIVSRAFGYCGLAVYESIVHGTTNRQSLVGQLTDLNYLPSPDASKEYHWALSANAAAARITARLFENAPAPLLYKIDSLEAAYQELFQNVSADVAERSVLFGQAVADSVYGYSKTDGGHKAFNRNFPASYVPPVGPGLWAPTNSQLALLPFWGNNRTFIKNLKTIVTTQGFPTFSTDPASAFYAEANTVYQAGQNVTVEQETIAYYWADEGFVTFTPPGHSLCIFSQLVSQGNFNLASAAEGYVKMGIAVADAFVYCWKVKYTHNLLRPSQYIQPNIDALWTPLIPNPPFPEYSSGHSTQSASASKILASLFGESFAFTDLTHTRLSLGLAPRSFSNFYEMAEEAGQSRIYAGIHFPSGNQQGRLSGYAIGEQVLALDFIK
ncbi:MAG: vanadium-dependent haloperoxidase [Cyclobacteriaceae bacterium]|nr:vanadium-dependent haloperoxidase [Cyclobacteriaceae bacterium]